MKYDRLAGRKTLEVAGFLDEFEKDEIKRTVDIVSLFEAFGVKLERKGKSYVGRCPWHADRNPSLSVDREKGLYHCFGCGESGDAFDLVQKMKGVSFREAIEYLKSRQEKASSGQSRAPDEEKRSDSSGAAPAVSSPPSKAPVPSEGPSPYLTLDTVSAYYHRRLYGAGRAVAYLEKRGLKKRELWERFGVGFADGSIIEKVSEGQKEHLKKLGILKESGREHFAGFITFPLQDEGGAAVGLYGRSIRDNGSVKHLYLKGPHRGLFNCRASRVYEEVILTESILDAVSLAAMGIENVQALCGANGLTEEHLGTLKADRVKRLVLALDSDEAGRNAAGELTERLLAEGFEVKRIYPPTKDWNDYLVAGSDAEAIRSRIEEAEVFSPSPSKGDLEVRREGPRRLFYLNGVRYRLLGVKELFISHLKVNMKAECGGESFYDNLDLYSARSRTAYSENLAHLFGIEPKRIEKDLIRILEYLEKERDRRLSELSRGESSSPLTDEERELGMELLGSPDLFDQIVGDMEVMGYVGEEMNKQLLYIAASSRKLDDPISVLILSQSASGKSLLVDTVKRLMPEKDVVSVTSLSDQALNYLPEGGLMHKFLILGEAVHSEAVEHQIREMLSGHELVRMVTVKDEKTGSLMSESRKSEVIVSAVMSSTRYEINPENASRCFLIHADESAEQTERIHRAQRGKYSLESYYARKHDVPRIVRKHVFAQRLLKKRLMVNPFAGHLRFPAVLIRTRRDHVRFMDLIACVGFLRQYQKQAKRERDPSTGDEFEYIECDLTDYEVAYRIMTEGVLASTFADVPDSLVRFYEELRALFCEAARENGLTAVEVSFTQRDIRERIGWLGRESAKKYLRRLVGYEYLELYRGGRRGMRNSYRLVADEPMERLDFSAIPTPEEVREGMREGG